MTFENPKRRGFSSTVVTEEGKDISLFGRKTHGIYGVVLAVVLLGFARAAELTNRLLSFARKQPFQPKVLVLSVLVADTAEVLRRTLGETIAVEIRISANSWCVLADPILAENTLLNLAINARDAMPNGVRLTIKTRNVPGNPSAGALPGDCVVVAVRDTSAGMTSYTVDCAFEPFFTTKGPEARSGLGLSLVQEFAEQSGGHAVICGHLGYGATVEI